MSSTVEVKGVVLCGDDLDGMTRPPGPAGRPSATGLGLIFLGAVGLGVTSSVLKLNSFGLLFLFASVLLALLGLIVSNAQRLRTLKRAFERSSYGQAPADYSFDSQGMKQRSSVGTADISWSQLSAVSETSGALVFWASPVHAFIVPRRYLDEGSLTALRALIDEARRISALIFVPAKGKPAV